MKTKDLNKLRELADRSARSVDHYQEWTAKVGPGLILQLLDRLDKYRRALEYLQQRLAEMYAIPVTNHQLINVIKSALAEDGG